MRLLIIRHGDPDYERDDLTEKGLREANLLADYLQKEKINAFYSSPLGRAKHTCAITAERFQTPITVLPWLREFDHPVDMDGQPHLMWDFPPEYLEKNPDLYDASRWLDTPVAQSGNIRKYYEEMANGLDELLAKHGYERAGRYYRVTRPNRDTVALFCHFGLESMLLSHIMNLAPVPLSHHFVARTSSVTTLYTEERREGVALFRCCGYGELSHLLAGNEPPSFSARFCETFDSDERHD